MRWFKRLIGLETPPEEETSSARPRTSDAATPPVPAAPPLDDPEILRRRGEKWEELAFDVSDRDTIAIMPGREKLAREVIRDLTHNPRAGRTHVFEGAPGAGKTSLLQMLKEEAESRDDVACLARLIEDPDPQTTRRILRTISEAFGVNAPLMDPREIAKTSGRKNVEIGLSGSVPTSMTPEPIQAGIQVGFGTSNEITSLPQEKSPEEGWLDEIAEAYRKKTGEDPHKGKHRALIMIDEAQNADEANHGRILRALHTSKALPIKVVIAGLSGTRDVLLDLRISRIDEERQITLGTLTEEKTLEAIRGNILHGYRSHPSVPIDANAPGTARIIQRLAKETHGWPQHIATAVRATWAALASHRKWHMGALKDEEIEQVIVRKFRDVRNRYYIARFKSARMNIAMIESAMKVCDTDTEFMSPKIREALREEFEKLTEDEQRTHIAENGSEPDDWLNKLVRSGILQDDPDKADAKKSPIPSMRTWISAKYEEEEKQTGRARTGSGPGIA